MKVAEAPFGAPLQARNRHKVLKTTVQSLTGTQRGEMGSRSGKGSGCQQPFSWAPEVGRILSIGERVFVGAEGAF